MRKLQKALIISGCLVSTTISVQAFARVATDADLNLPGATTAAQAVQLLGERNAYTHTTTVRLIAAPATVVWTDNPNTTSPDPQTHAARISTATLTPDAGGTVCIIPSEQQVKVTNSSVRTLTADSGLTLTVADDDTPAFLASNTGGVYCGGGLANAKLDVGFHEAPESYGPGEHEITLIAYSLPH